LVKWGQTSPRVSEDRRFCAACLVGREDVLLIIGLSCHSHNVPDCSFESSRFIHLAAIDNITSTRTPMIKTAVPMLQNYLLVRQIVIYISCINTSIHSQPALAPRGSLLMACTKSRNRRNTNHAKPTPLGWWWGYWNFNKIVMSIETQIDIASVLVMKPA